MQANYRFTAYEGQEGDSKVGMYYVPITYVGDEIGPHRPGTGMVLASKTGSELTSVYGYMPTFNPVDIANMKRIASIVSSTQPRYY